jgi:hypothetical protein
MSSTLLCKFKEIQGSSAHVYVPVYLDIRRDSRAIR